MQGPTIDHWQVKSENEWSSLFSHSVQFAARWHPMTSQIELAFSHRALSLSPSNPFPFQVVAFVVFACVSLSFVFVLVNSCHHVLPLFKLDPSVLFRVSSIILGTIPHRHYKIFWQAHLLLEVSEWTECYVFIWFRIRDFFLFCPSSVLSSRKKDGFLKIWPPWRRGKNNS